MTLIKAQGVVVIELRRSLLLPLGELLMITRWVVNGTRKLTHRIIQPRHSQTKGMVGRFNGRISEVL